MYVHVRGKVAFHDAHHHHTSLLLVNKRLAVSPPTACTICDEVSEHVLFGLFVGAGFEVFTRTAVPSFAQIWPSNSSSVPHVVVGGRTTRVHVGEVQKVEPNYRYEYQVESSAVALDLPVSDFSFKFLVLATRVDPAVDLWAATLHTISRVYMYYSLESRCRNKNMSVATTELVV